MPMQCQMSTLQRVMRDPDCMLTISMIPGAQGNARSLSPQKKKRPQCKYSGHNLRKKATNIPKAGYRLQAIAQVAAWSKHVPNFLENRKSFRHDRMEECPTAPHTGYHISPPTSNLDSSRLRHAGKKSHQKSTCSLQSTIASLTKHKTPLGLASRLISSARSHNRPAVRSISVSTRDAGQGGGPL